jgi:ribosomal protein S18 acetylase RimI-like enzyme
MLEKITTTYLEITKNDPVNYKKDFQEKMEIREVETDVYLNLILYAGIGLPWRWYNRLRWAPEEWVQYFSGQRVKSFIGFAGNRLVGFYELILQENNETEIKLFGIFPSYIGKGLGGLLLSHALKSSFDYGASRVWLHTCSSDADTALGNYLARGFRIFREEMKFEQVPGKEEILNLITGFYGRYIDLHSSIIDK